MSVLDNREVARFVDEFSRELDAGNAAIFAGAGLSVPAGFVNWRDLLRDIADELELDVDLETDLVSLAQFHVNENGNNRYRINQAIIEALAADNPPTNNHRLLARLPIATWWTTNYDTLIERALNAAQKVVDAKSDVQQLANTRPRRDAVVYKMHGDVTRPNEAVVTRDDYERYERDRGAFLTALAGDLVSKTFLFLGFSFTDPNLDEVLSRVRIHLNNNQRRHYAIFRTHERRPEDSDQRYAHDLARQQLVIKDLRRFNVRAILVDEYSDIDLIVAEIERRYRRQTVFVSSSAADFEPWGEAAVLSFMRSLGSALIKKGVRIQTGLGLGVGNALFTGAVEAVVSHRHGHIEDWITIRPFPQAIPDKEQRERFWEAYRQDVISSAGIALFLFGTKQEGDAIVEANGVVREFEIAREKGLVVLPIGATGGAAGRLTGFIEKDGSALTGGNAAALALLQELPRKVDDLTTLIEPITKLVSSMSGASKAID